MLKILSGTAASRGKVTGIARVLKDESQFSLFKVGDILVTKQTSPAWTPLFLAASAVVTEIGGSLSHAALVAREYSIPAVVGVKNATKILKNGLKIMIDGDKGTVEIND